MLMPLRAREREQWTLRPPLRVGVLGPDDIPLHDDAAAFERIRRGPERRSDGHRGELAAGVLERIRLARDLVLLGQSRVEDPPEVHVARAAAAREDHGLPGPDGNRRLCHRDVALGAITLHARLGSRHEPRLVAGLDAEHASRSGRLPEQAIHVVVQEELDTFGPRTRLERPDVRGASSAPRAHGAGHVRSFEHRDARPQRGDPHRPRVEFRRPDHDAVGNQELERRRAVVGERALNRPVVVTVVGDAVRQHDGPVGQILEHLIGRILDAVFLLPARAASEGQAAPAQNAVAANVEVGLDDDHRGAFVPCPDGGRHACGAGADDDDIRLEGPRARLRFGLGAAQPGQGRCAHARGSAPVQKVAAADRCLLLFLTHALVPP